MNPDQLQQIKIQELLDDYATVCPQYEDIQAMAEVAKINYDIAPEFLADENGNNYKNPQKENLKAEYEVLVKEASALKIKLDKMKEYFPAGSVARECAENYDKAFHIYAQYYIKSAQLKNLEELEYKINELDRLVNTQP